MSRWLRALPLAALIGLTLPCSPQSVGDKAFLKKAAQSNIDEIELSKLALQRSANPKVLDFARTMVRDHESLQKELTPWLVRDGVPPTGSLDNEHKKLIDRIKGFSNDAFDREYVKAMDMDHHKVLAEVRKELKSTKNPDLKTQLVASEKVIAAHTQAIDAISATMQLAPPGQTERKAGTVIR